MSHLSRSLTSLTLGLLIIIYNCSAARKRSESCNEDSSCCQLTAAAAARDSWLGQAPAAASARAAASLRSHGPTGPGRGSGGGLCPSAPGACCRPGLKLSTVLVLVGYSDSVTSSTFKLTAAASRCYGHGPSRRFAWLGTWAWELQVKNVTWPSRWLPPGAAAAQWLRTSELGLKLPASHDGGSTARRDSPGLGWLSWQHDSPSPSHLRPWPWLSRSWSRIWSIFDQLFLACFQEDYGMYVLETDSCNIRDKYWIVLVNHLDNIWDIY